MPWDAPVMTATFSSGTVALFFSGVDAILGSPLMLCSYFLGRETDDFPDRLRHRRRQKRLGRPLWGVTGIGGASLPYPSGSRNGLDVSTTSLRSPRPKWP